MLEENLTCIQCEVGRDCLPYMKYTKEGNNNSFKHGKGCCKEDIDKFFLHTYPRFAFQHCRCRFIISCENSCNMTCKEPSECQQWHICLKWLNSCPNTWVCFTSACLRSEWAWLPTEAATAMCS